MNFDTMHSTPQQEKGEKSEMERKLNPYVREVTRTINEVLNGGKYKIMPDVVVQDIKDQFIPLSDEEVKWVADQLQESVNSIPGSQEHQEAYQKALDHLLVSRAFERKVARDPYREKEYVSEKELIVNDVVGQLAFLIKGSHGEDFDVGPVLEPLMKFFSGSSSMIGQNEGRRETAELHSTLKGIPEKVKEKMGGRYTSDTDKLEHAIEQFIVDSDRISF